MPVYAGTKTDKLKDLAGSIADKAGEAAATASEKAGVKVYVVEHDKDVPDPFASFEQSFKYLADNFIR